jgi:signal transduction histidine kinase
MTEIPNSELPTSFWIIGGVFLLWNFFGLMIYYDQVTMSPEVLADTFNAAQQAFLEDMPLWATSAYAIAVTAGVIASLLLLVRNALALPVFIVSLAGVIVQDLNSFVMNDGLAVWGSSALYLPTLVLVLCVVEIWYSRSAKAKGWIS